MVFLAIAAVIGILVLTCAVFYYVCQWHPKVASINACRVMILALIAVLVVNSVTFSLARGVRAMSFEGGEPELLALWNPGVYQTDEVHYLIGGTTVDPARIKGILPDELNGAIKVALYQQFHYDADAVLDAIDDDTRRFGYEKVTIWAVGAGAMAINTRANASLREKMKIVLIDPCPNTLVLKSDLQKQANDGAPWRRAASYLLGWISLAPGKLRCSLNLQTMMAYELTEEAKRASKPNADNVIGLVTSKQDEYLRSDALKGLYADAIQVTVPAKHVDIMNSSDLYRAALEKIWTQYLAETDAEASEYTGPFPSEPYDPFE